MKKYKIEFSKELKNYGLKDFTVTIQADKQDYLQAIRMQIAELYNIEDTQLLCGNNINIEQVE